MGGLSAAYNDPFHLNMANPAALGHLMATDLETGFFAKYSSLSDGDTSVNLWSGNLNYFALGMPIINPINRALEKKSDKIGLGMAFVSKPYSNVGYNLITTQEFPEIGEAVTNFKGSGGTYRLMWGNGFRYGRFSAGVNMGYLFGKTSLIAPCNLVMWPTSRISRAIWTSKACRVFCGMPVRNYMFHW